MPWRNELQKQHAKRKSDSLWRSLRTVDSPPDREIRIGDKTLLNFCSNNYLSLANHPAMIEAATVGSQDYGTSTSASHLIAGHTSLHAELEKTIANFTGAEKAILFSTGYMANLAVPDTLLGRNDLLVQDRLNHASIIDGGKISNAKVRRYPHNDIEAADKLLRASDHNRKLLVTDGVFSMDGDIAPLAQLHSLCQRHSAVLMVDDAHGFGVIGDTGIGSLEAAALKPTENVLLLGTLSKACGSFGAFIAGDAVYIDALIQQARSFIYTTALPSPVVAASIKAIELIKTESWRREKLSDNIQYFRKRVKEHGLLLADSATPIQPIIVGDNLATLELSEKLLEQGFMVVAIRPPTVAVGEARLRITLMTDHTEDDIDRLVTTLHLLT
jgi:8-amino-7-oxononanoate synthase